MRRDSATEYDIELDADDFVDLFKNQETTGDGTRIFIKKLQFLRALGKLDPLSQLTPKEQEELQEKHGSPHSPRVIESEVMETNYAPEKREGEYDDICYWLKRGSELRLEDIDSKHGQWAVDRLIEDDRVEYDRDHFTFHWSDD